MKHLGQVKAYMMHNTNIFDNLLKVNSFPLCHSQIRILDGSFFHCCLFLVVYMIHLSDGGPTLEMDPMHLQVEGCHDIEIWYNTTHNKFASYAWIDSPYDCLVASCISVSSMIYELVHFLSKFVVIFIDGIFIHHDHIS